MKVVNERGAGRPKLSPELKKKQVNLKMSPWVNEWLNAQQQSKAALIEQAIVKHYKLTPPEN